MKAFKKLQTNLFIGGKFVPAISGKTFDVLNPTTGKVITKVAEGRAEDIDVAVEAAKKALIEWKKVTPSARQAYMMKLADLIEKQAEEFAHLETLDNGKTLSDSKFVDVPSSISCLRYYAGWCDKLSGQTLRVNSNDHFVYTLVEPKGVVGQIIPWNFPLIMALWKIGPVLATGCVTILKPAEQTPLTALKLAECIKEAGIPDGVINIVPGFGPTAGARLASHPDVDKVAFTGSVDVGRKIMVAAAESNIKDVTLELGGKSPLIICDDADIEKAVEIANMGMFFNQGQVCCASTRILVHEGIYDAFVKACVEKAKHIKVGDPMEEDTFQGPQVSEEQMERILKYIDIGKNEDKANMQCGGKRVANKEGYFIEPTVFTNVTNDMRIAREEIFGPVMAVIKFKDDEEAIKIANDTTFGLAAGVVTPDFSRAMKLTQAVKGGTVWLNTYGETFDNAPFGGYGQSGIGRELGEDSLKNYLNVKTVISKL
mmetsp:Transcript_7504/g.11133  ORF Transcript_7504/g.11133 Transcript_7504/m.11133 type:complete len:485 (+) Transcript_7504:23-1477(+)